MKVAAVATALLLAGSAAAAPSERLKAKLKQRRAERNQARADLRRMGRTGLPLAVNYTSMSDRVKLEHTSNVEYDSNWAGAAITTSKVTAVSGQFNVPTPKEPSGGSANTEYGGAAWVGIDGFNCQTAILQTGVEFVVEGTETAYSGWYEWYPDYSYSFSNFEVEAGHEVKASVLATSATAGTATLENLTTGKTVTHKWTNQASVGKLCQTDAEWIVEDYEEGGKLVPFVNFGTVTIQDAGYTANGVKKGVTGATILDVEQNNKIETSCSVSGSSTVKCTYLA